MIVSVLLKWYVYTYNNVMDTQPHASSVQMNTLILYDDVVVYTGYPDES
jgi:hypothetical protein